MQSPKLKFVVVVLVALIGVVMMLAYQTRPDVPSLLPLAHKIASVPGATPYYWWLSDHEVMLVQNPERKDGVFLRHDITTNADTAMPALTEVFHKTGGSLDAVQVSPDGKWTLWNGAGQTTVLASIDGAKFYSIPQKHSAHNIWLVDGSGWIEVWGNGEVIDNSQRHTVENPRQSSLPVPVTYAFPNDRNKVNISHIAATLEDQLLIPLWDSGEGQLPTAHIVSSGFGANVAAAKQLNFPAVHENERGDVLFFPVRNKMAWALEFYQPLPKLLRDLSSNHAPASHVSTGLWITDLNGQKTFVIGCMDTIRQDKNSGPFNIQFNPDGSRLSYVYQNALWTVPTE